MAQRIVVIGAVAAGMSAASQAKRRLPDASVVVLERGSDVSYGACGMPYNIEAPGRSIDDLVVISAERFRSERHIDLRTRTEALAIDTAQKLVRARELDSGREYDEPYDKLVIATGARAVKPRLPGLDLPGVFVLRELSDGAAIKDYIGSEKPARAVIIGAGYIGMEMAEALRGLGIEVTVVEKMTQILPGWDPAIVDRATRALLENDVSIQTGATVTAIEKSPEGQLRVCTDAGCHEGELVLVSVGVRPNVELAADAGIALGATGAIQVDDHMRTSAPDVFAAGDCAEAAHLMLGKPVWIPLGTTANKQGKVAGVNASGDDASFAGIVGTAGFKLFELEVARTGLGTAELEQGGYDFVRSVSKHSNRAHAFPGAGKITDGALRGTRQRAPARRPDGRPRRRRDARGRVRHGPVGAHDPRRHRESRPGLRAAVRAGLRPDPDRGERGEEGPLEAGGGVAPTQSGVARWRHSRHGRLRSLRRGSRSRPGGNPALTRSRWIWLALLVAGAAIAAGLAVPGGGRKHARGGDHFAHGPGELRSRCSPTARRSTRTRRRMPPRCGSSRTCTAR